MVCMQPSKILQTGIGLSLAALVFGAWGAIHFWAMFGLRLENANWLLVPMVIAVQCWLSVGMFIVAHDAMHGSLSPRWPRLGSAIGAIMLFTYAGFSWSRMRNAHFAHHRHVGSDTDPDYNADNPRDFWPWYMTFLKRYFGWMSMIWVWSVVLIYYFALNVPVTNIVLLYGFPAIASSMQLFYFGTYRPHRHDEIGFVDAHNSRTNAYGKLASLFTCFHFGYHHEHHLSPSLPWWALPARHKLYLAEREI